MNNPKNDLFEVRRLADTLDPPPDHPRPELTHRVLHGIREPAAAATRPKRRRLAWRLAAAGGIASLLLAGILASQVISLGDHKPTQVASAAEVLRKAAATAAADKTGAPRADQFIYTKTISHWGSYAVGKDGKPIKEADQGPQTGESWVSVDGTRDGQDGFGKDATRRWGCGPERPRAKAGDPQIGSEKPGVKPTSPCLPMPAFRAGLPTNADAALKWLYDNSQGQNPRDVQAFITLGDLLRDEYVLPTTRSAFFEAAARIPGVELTKDLTDLAGRKGVGVGFADSKLIFDSKTYEYLGEATTNDVVFGTASPDPGRPSLKPGAKYEPVYTVVKTAIVDQVGQRP